MRLVLEGDTVKFEPDFKDFEVPACLYLKIIIIFLYSLSRESDWFLNSLYLLLDVTDTAPKLA